MQLNITSSFEWKVKMRTKCNMYMHFFLANVKLYYSLFIYLSILGKIATGNNDLNNRRLIEYVIAYCNISVASFLFPHLDQQSRNVKWRKHDKFLGRLHVFFTKHSYLVFEKMETVIYWINVYYLYAFEKSFHSPVNQCWMKQLIYKVLFRHFSYKKYLITLPWVKPGCFPHITIEQ